MKRAFIISLAVALSVILMGALPDIWFRNHLEKSWDVDDQTVGSELKKSRRNRLCLIFAVDGVPYWIIRDLKKEGYFKGFYPPGRLVSTFPSLTRPAFSKMLIGGKPYGYERLYYNDHTSQLEGASLIKKAFATQKEHRDYHPKLHFLGFPGYIAYVFPDKFTRTTLDAFKNRLKRFQGDEFIAYMGISDAIAHVEGEAATIEFMRNISRLLYSVRNELGMELDIVLFSDHANNFTLNRRVDLSSALVDAGYRNVNQLINPRDFVLPQNGFVSFATIYTASDNARSIAEVLSSIEGVDFSAYRSGKSIVVQGSAGMARISKRHNRFQYSLIDGDPLDLKNKLLRLQRLGKVDSQGFIHEKEWWMVTKNHNYPDPLRRIWEGIHDLVQHPGTLLISLKDGFAFGPPMFEQPMISQRAGTHGALLASHSYGFLMTDFRPVNDVNRPADVASLLASAAEAKETGIKLLSAD